MICETERELAGDASGFTESVTYKVHVRQNLHAPYEFRQPPSARHVFDFARAVAIGTLHDTLGKAIYDLRRHLAASRVALLVSLAMPPDEEGAKYRTALLKDLARQSEHLRECEAAVLTVTRLASGVLWQARCPRCHNMVKAKVAWHHDAGYALAGASSHKALLEMLAAGIPRRSDKLVLEHMAGSMLCSGTGEVVP